jgi:hypothetical protein
MRRLAIAKQMHKLSAFGAEEEKASGALSAARTIKIHESWPRYATG